MRWTKKLKWVNLFATFSKYYLSETFSAAAIKASLAETLEGGESSDGSDLETFTDDDTNNSFDLKRKAPHSTGLDAECDHIPCSD